VGIEDNPEIKRRVKVVDQVCSLRRSWDADVILRAWDKAASKGFDFETVARVLLEMAADPEVRHPNLLAHRLRPLEGLPAPATAERHPSSRPFAGRCIECGRVHTFEGDRCEPATSTPDEHKTKALVALGKEEHLEWRLARKIACPWCRAKPGLSCVTAPATAREREMVGVHPSRSEAAGVPHVPNTSVLRVQQTGA
jgi:hypothetical protein